MRKKEPIWVPRMMVDVIHYELIREFGGSFGIFNEDSIESALARPKNKYAYESSDLIALAAAYGYGLCMNHGYVDGNKRTAFAVMATFLHGNGIELMASEVDAVHAMEAVASGDWDEKSLEKWLRDNAEDRKG